MQQAGSPFRVDPAPAPVREYDRRPAVLAFVVAVVSLVAAVGLAILQTPTWSLRWMLLGVWLPCAAPLLAFLFERRVSRRVRQTAHLAGWGFIHWARRIVAVACIAPFVAAECIPDAPPGIFAGFFGFIVASCSCCPDWSTSTSPGPASFERAHTSDIGRERTPPSTPFREESRGLASGDAW